jgi:hypothetical protein
VLALPSSEPDAIKESLNGFLLESAIAVHKLIVYEYQSVSKTTAVCPRNNGNRSGSLPLSDIGITANAPPPPDSQLTAMYSGFALTSQCKSLIGSVASTLTKFESHAFLDILRLS